LLFDPVWPPPVKKDAGRLKSSKLKNEVAIRFRTSWWQFASWLYHRLLYPSFSTFLDRRCIHACLHWIKCIRRRTQGQRPPCAIENPLPLNPLYFVWWAPIVKWRLCSLVDSLHTWSVWQSSRDFISSAIHRRSPPSPI
jgi:hypothetical protein